MGDMADDSENDAPLETDPTGRYQRCDEVLGEGAYKLVYRACDLEEGNEVAWNQLRFDHLSRREAQKILSEIGILQSIRNDHIINFYASWSTPSPNVAGGERIVFITELMSSGTLKQYLKKTLKGALKPKVLKSWCRQILLGLAYMHTHQPPIIHRDLKCDNIFINGNNGQLKIGDLGLAVVRHRTHVSSVLGTPEFMAPELYDEKYDEKIDIYAFGMCVLEMVTKDYPYAECTNQAQIYRKVSQGIKPKALDDVQDSEVREFIDRCLDHDAKTRPSAQELLDSEFLKPCANIPLSSSEATSGASGHFALDGHDHIDVVRQSTPAPGIASTLTLSTATLPIPVPGPIPLRIQTAAPEVAVVPQSGAIAGAEFTLTTVDVVNKTYHIRSNLLPPTPTSAVENPQTDATSALPQEQDGQTQATRTEAIEPSKDLIPEPALAPTHTHSYSKMCSIQVEQYGNTDGNRLNLKMVCTCPVAGSSRESSVEAPGTHEIKFPFDLDIDTVEEVVAEMVREQILSADDRAEATSRIQEVVIKISHAMQEKARKDKEKKAARLLPAQPSSKAPRSQSSVQSAKQHQHSQAIAMKKPHHRQLKVPPASDWSQYGSSPTELRSPDYFLSSSLGSNASYNWTGTTLTANSDQGREAFFEQTAASQPPPSLSDTTFPPLMAASRRSEHGQLRKELAVTGQAGGDSMARPTYSGAVQQYYEHSSHHDVPMNASRSLSPLLAPRRTSAVPPRPKSVHDVSYMTPYPGAGAINPLSKSVQDLSYGAGATSPPLVQRTASSAARLGERPRSSSTATTAFDRDDDVGYTSPYRHGVSGSSVKSHRRSPSCDISVYVPQAMACVPSSLRSFSAAHPLQRSTSNTVGYVVSKAQSESGQPLNSYPASPLARRAMVHDLSVVPSATAATASNAGLRQEADETRSSATSGLDSRPANDVGSNGKAATPGSGGSDSGISSGASSPASAVLHDQQHQQQQQLGKQEQRILVSAVPQPVEAPMIVAPLSERLSPYSFDPLSGAHGPAHGLVRAPAAMSESQHLMSSSLSSDGLFPVMMTSEAKKNIELWSDNVQQTTNAELVAPARAAAAAAAQAEAAVGAAGVATAEEEDIHPHHHLLPHAHAHAHAHPPSLHLLHPLHGQHGSVPSSSCPDLSDREEDEEDEAGILDEDLRSLREQQRREIEWMRLQHEMQWEKMMKMKEQREKSSESTRLRRASEVMGGSWSASTMGAM
ncbi:hypothetical protein BGZ72_006483 [Mortierella alpina]|nr:hypothetical protein BGZ72_006483 [Mortierella alpina]